MLDSGSTILVIDDVMSPRKFWSIAFCKGQRELDRDNGTAWGLPISRDDAC